MADLIIGSSNIISTDSGTPTIQSGVKFPAGIIVQIVNTTMNRIDEDISTSTTYFEPGNTINNGEMSRTITPKASGNKLLVMVNYLPRGRAPTVQHMRFDV